MVALYFTLIYLVAAALVKKYYKIAISLIAVFSITVALDIKYTNDRFLQLDPNTLTITRLNGNIAQININDVKRFWGIAEGAKGVRTGCYLWVQTSNEDYRSVTTDDKYQCGKDAKYLNEKYHKN